MSFDGYNLTMDEIRTLVDLGENPTDMEMAAVGLVANSDGVTWNIHDMRLFEKARVSRELRLTSADIPMIMNRIKSRQEQTDEERKGS